MRRYNNPLKGIIQKLAETTPEAVEAGKNIKSVVGARLRALNTTTLIRWLLLTLYIPIISACTDSDINIPKNRGINFSQTLVAIYSPTSGEILTANEPFILSYEVLRAIKTSYVKIQVDKTTPVTVAKIKGKHHINALTKGIHTIRVSEYRSDGKPSGSEAIIKINMK